MTRRPLGGYPRHRDPRAVNLVGFEAPPVFNAGYYLLNGPHQRGVMDERVGVDLATRERQRLLYKVKHDLTDSGRTPTPWRMALGEVLALERTGAGSWLA